jgi:MFS family permease
MGYALGPLFLAPMSEIYGRYPVIVLSCWFFNALLIGCSFAPNMPSLIVMRLLAGTGGSAVMAIAPAIVADLYPVERRSFAMGIVLVCSMVPSAVICAYISLQIIQSVSPAGKAFILISLIKVSMLICCSWTYLWRIHRRTSWVAMGVLDFDHGKWSSHHADYVLHG